MSTRVDVTGVIDNSRFGPYQLLVITLCAMCLVMDGFDVQAMGYVAPVVIREWGIAKETLSPVFGAGLFGMLIGSSLFQFRCEPETARNRQGEASRSVVEAGSISVA